MKKTLTITGILLLVITVLLAGAALVASQFIDPNKFKGRISQYVYAKTGQVLVINGNMNWSVFPWIGLRANDLTYYNAPSFTPKILISAKEMDIKVKLMPLITGKVEVGNITLNNATLNLIKNKNGTFNWQTIGKADKKENQQSSAKHSNTISNLTIASLKIKNGKLNWYDQQKNTQTLINSLNISSKRIKLGQPFPVGLQFDVLNNNKKKSLSVDLESDMTLLPANQQYALQNIKLKSQIFNEKGNIELKATGNLTSDLKKETCLADIQFNLNDIKGQFNLTGNQLSKKPYFYGTLSTNTFNLKKALQEFGTPMETKNSDALTSVALLSKIEATDSNIALTQFHATLDKTDLFGNVNVLTKSKNIHFNLTANQIDLDDYLSNDKTSTKQDAASSSSVSQQKMKPGKNNPWNINGDLKITSLMIDKLKMSNIVATLDMRNHVIKVSPLRANLYKGQLDGSLVVDQRLKNKTTISLKQSIKNLNIKDLLHEFSDSDKLSGHTDLNADLVATTNENTSFLAALNGKINFALRDGAIQGVDIIYQLTKAHAFIKHLGSPSFTNSKQTTFDSFTANATVTNGVINSDDLMLNSEYLKVTGKGFTNLVTKEIHYRLNALAQPKLVKENNDIGKEVTAYQVPIKVGGKLTKPSVNIDFVELAKNFYAKQIEKPISTHIETNVNHLKDKLKDQVQEKLKAYSPSKLLQKLTNKSEENENEQTTSSSDTTAESDA